MAVPQALTDALKAIDTDTTAIAAVVDALRATITTSMTQAEVDSVTTTLGGISTRLKATAADPAAPVPPGPVPVFTRAKKP